MTNPDEKYVLDFDKVKAIKWKYMEEAKSRTSSEDLKELYYNLMHRLDVSYIVIVIEDYDFNIQFSRKS